MENDRKRKREVKKISAMEGIKKEALFSKLLIVAFWNCGYSMGNH
jgi:hypothetical protein